MSESIIDDAMDDQQTKMHKDHISWLKSLDFYSDEIKFFEKELTHVVNANNDSLSKIEHVEEYQKILEKKIITLEEIREEIKYQQKILTMDEILPENLQYHLILKEKFQNFVNYFEELKPSFKRFSSHSD